MKNNANTINEAENLIDSLNHKGEVKRVKPNDGLMERYQYESKVILTEDNRQVLFG